MTYIDLEHMNKEQSEQLFLFISQQATGPATLWKANQEYEFQDKSGNVQTITLSCALLSRHRKENKAGLRFEILTKELVGKGSYGMVYNAITLKQRGNSVELKDKKRVVKIQQHDQTNTIEDLKKEFELSELAGHLGIKSPVILRLRYDFSYTIMKKIPGKELFKLINEERDSHKYYSVELRLEIAVAILKALELQVTRRGIIHRDLNLKNIIVDLEQKPITANVIDFGLSTRVGVPSSKFFSSVNVYYAPEWQSSVSVQIDVYSVGKMLEKLFDPYFLRLMPDATSSSIQVAMSKMTLHDNRSTIEEAITTFTQILSNYKHTLDENAKSKAAQIKHSTERRLSDLSMFQTATQTVVSTTGVVTNTFDIS